MSAPWDDATVRRVAKEIREELGEWTLGELGDAGLADAIWDTWKPFQSLTADERTAFQGAVYEVIYG